MGNGLFGLGGATGFGSPMPEQMSGFYDPEAMRRAQIKQALMATGMSMLAQGPSQLPINLGTSLGQGLQQGMQAYQKTGDEYRDIALQGYKMKQQADETAYGHQRDAATDAFRNRQFDYGVTRDQKADEWKRLELEAKAKDATNSEYGLNPVWLQNQKGEWMLVQPSKDGSAPRPMQFPEGYSPAPQNRTVDTGTSFVTMPTRGDGAPMGGVIPKNVADAEAAKAVGGARGEASSQLPGARLTAESVKMEIADVLKDPALESISGYGAYIPNAVSSSAMVNARSKINKLGGQAFLQARTILKGGGAISDMESKRAEAAYSRIEMAQQSGNVQDLKDALSEFSDAVDLGVRKLEATAGQQPQGGGGWLVKEVP